MGIQVELKPHAVSRITEYGRFIYLRQADGPVSVTLMPESGGELIEMKMARHEHYDITETGASFTEVTLRNLTDEDNVVEVEIGNHKFRPSSNGADINVAVTKATIDLPVEVKNAPSVEQINQPVTVQKITDKVDVNIASSGIDVPIEVKNAPSIEQINQPVTIKKDNRRLVDLGKRTFDAQGQVVIGDNALRYELIMVCANTNTDMVLANGIPLFAGQSFVLTADKAVTLTGATGDDVYISEVRYE